MEMQDKAETRKLHNLSRSVNKPVFAVGPDVLVAY